MNDMIDITNICEGNPDCIAFVTDALERDNTDTGVVKELFTRMENNFITSEKLYMLWNDCLERNTNDAILVMKADTIESINEHINYDHGGCGILYTEEELESMRLGLMINYNLYSHI